MELFFGLPEQHILQTGSLPAYLADSVKALKLCRKTHCENQGQPDNPGNAWKSTIKMMSDAVTEC